MAFFVLTKARKTHYFGANLISIDDGFLNAPEIDIDYLYFK